jgi:hypothetical protein
MSFFTSTLVASISPHSALCFIDLSGYSAGLASVLVLVLRSLELAAGLALSTIPLVASTLAL